MPTFSSLRLVFGLLTSLLAASTLPHATPHHNAASTRSSILSHDDSDPPCELPVWIARDFEWRNATNNLDCSNASQNRRYEDEDEDPDSQQDHDRNGKGQGQGRDRDNRRGGGREKDNKDQDKENKADDVDDLPSFNPLCLTGLDRHPPGYGPPDTLSVFITNIGPCRQSNPGSVPPRAIGADYVRCGSSAPTLYFEGDSNSRRSEALFRVTEQFACPDRDDDVAIYTGMGEVRFPIVCEREDDGVSCRSEEEEVRVPVGSWRRGFSRWVDGIGLIGV